MTAALKYLGEIADEFFASQLRRAALKIERQLLFSRQAG
jgi:hypothetical protein